MKESTKINMERNFEAATAGMVSGIAEGFGCEIIGYILSSNARIRTKILATTTIGALTVTGAIVSFKVWQRSDEQLAEKYREAVLKEGVEELHEMIEGES